jgi:hypothetical protein
MPTGDTEGLKAGRTRLNRERKIDGADRKRIFFAAYEEYGTVAKACEVAGIARSTQRVWMTDPDFVDVFEQSRRAFAEYLEQIALDRVKDPHGNRGSDVLLIGLLNANWPQKYRQTSALDQDYAREVLSEMKRVFKQEKVTQPPQETELSVPMERTLAQILEKRRHTPEEGKKEEGDQPEHKDVE